MSINARNIYLFHGIKVIDETMRVITFSPVVFREAKSDVNINGYLIPKGWKAVVWFRSVHLDPEIYPNPKEFNPYRGNKEHKVQSVVREAYSPSINHPPSEERNV
ncbi:ent-kaurenoic acid oxidase 2-like isoform X2 [Vigna radiata var. radiata]|uniref:Ent-kaurenoic acid oxidase 2-like isoform X2 n=1 Tax=Vigna radiata var. radiata TaxID=3916 RepID=A0A3Q0ETR7_VIGRR|nr:ent-kaurenoic acid oxidase 2-like isoform X2 [Vigna radiata var. radiata]